LENSVSKLVQHPCERRLLCGRKKATSRTPRVGSLRYGVVEIIVHDSQVTQIEKTERLRLDKPTTETRPNRGE
jgi:hypothetical protein